MTIKVNEIHYWNETNDEKKEKEKQKNEKEIGKNENTKRSTIKEWTYTECMY